MKRVLPYLLVAGIGAGIFFLVRKYRKKSPEQQKKEAQSLYQVYLQKKQAGSAAKELKELRTQMHTLGWDVNTEGVMVEYKTDVA